ncbi:AzlD domain-containing protein [Uliginosibacterium gangwonense]|uniref:AzlD domain-containing protein n=1 Tax=Uliginosibacterium gangwonense TaxID=392736 RepID=UPI00035F976C|nr:AzlD domain-containing protein [Uliginosibacterium gangwonense]
MNKDLLLFLAMLAGGLLTYAARALFIVSGERFALGPRFRQLLSYVPPAVLAALIAPEVLLHKGQLVLSPGNPRLLATVVAVLAALYTRSVLATITLGMCALWCVQAMQ